jgi:hypothetical protein
VITRSARDSWPLIKTVRAVIDQMKAQRHPASAARIRWEQARAQREEQRIEREAHRLIPASEFNDAWRFVIGVLTSKLVAIAPRCTGDWGLRNVIEEQVNQARHEACNEYERQAEALRTTGKAAMVR